MASNKPIVLILCGGKSLRLWPLSRYKSKNFIDVFGFSPLELTIKRFLKVTPAKNIFLAASHTEQKALSKIKLIPKKNIILEPQSKNTAAAVLLSLQYFRKYRDKVLIISPVDNFIENKREFYKALNKAQRQASLGSICVFGIKPLKPSVNFGYIQVQGAEDNGIFNVKRFIEKPNRAKAIKLIKQGNCFHNSGMFVTSISTLMDEYKRYYPPYSCFVEEFDNDRLSSFYKRIADIPFDKAIMEKSKRVKLVKSEFSWKDFGSWQAIYEILSKDSAKNAVEGRPRIVQSKNNLIYLSNPRKKVLALGLKDIIFVDTANFTLIAGKGDLDSLKSAVKKFKL